MSLDWYTELEPPGDPDGNNNVQLGSTHVGAYIAPGGQWFIGVGKVVGCGMSYEMWDEPSHQYILVEPIGNESEFFHPVTMEWMHELPVNPIPGLEIATCAVRRLGVSILDGIVRRMRRGGMFILAWEGG
ncbi:hypothetical protein BDW74DRAFT_179586 [Aspergillus multicolor]|uniref:uncharacterized protein n=1 Tax=Aspergillus multicolor TaxID=41759 RepID=UPI003CCE32D8